MTKNEYLERLRNNLKNIPYEEINNIIEYYREYFEDAGEENEDKVISELGNPEILASKVSADYVIKDIERNTAREGNENRVKKGASNLWIIILAICAFPAWFPLVITVAALAFSMVVVVASLLFAFAVSAVAVAAGGIFSIIIGIVLLFSNIATGISAIGAGCLCVGIGALFFAGAIGLIRLLKLIILQLGKVKVRKKGNEYE